MAEEIAPYDPSRILGGISPTVAPPAAYGKHSLALPPEEVSDDVKRQQSGGLLLKDLPIANASDNKGTASFDALAKVAAVDDEATKLKILAKELFPELAPEEAISRMGYVEGEPIYLKDGRIYRATPTGVGGMAKRAGASVTGNIWPIAGGVAGAALATTPPGIVALGALGAMGGAAVRKAEGVIGLGEPAPTREQAMRDVGLEGLFSVGGGLMGIALGRYLTRNVAKDIALHNPQAAAELARKAKEWEIDLTPAETTGLPSLAQQQKTVAKMPQTSDKIDPFLKERHGQIDRAVNRFLDTISVEDSIELGARRTKEAAADTVERLVKERKAAAGPVYTEAFDKFKGIPAKELPKIEALQARLPKGIEADAVETARQEGIDLADPRNSLLGMHYLQVSLRKQISAAQKAGDWNGARILRENRDALVSIMDRISPKDKTGQSLYEKARGIYAGNSPQVEQAREGLIGRIASADNEEGLMQLSERLFNAKRNGPIAVSRVMSQIRQADPDAADMALRGFLQQRWQEAARQQQTTSGNAMAGSRYQRDLMGTKKDQDILKAVMTGQQWKAFTELMDVLEATGRAPMAGSDTVWNAMSVREMERQAVPLPLRANLAGLREALKAKAFERYGDKIAEVITSKDGMARIKELKQLPPGSQARLNKIGALLGITATPRDESPSDVPLGPK